MADLKAYAITGPAGSTPVSPIQGLRASFFPLGESAAGGPPVLTITSVPTGKTGAFVCRLYDDAPGLRTHILWCRVGGAGAAGTIVHDGTSFWAGFINGSTRTGTGTTADPYEFKIKRDLLWPQEQQVDIYVRAIDQSGNLKDG